MRVTYRDTWDNDALASSLTHILIRCAEFVERVYKRILRGAVCEGKTCGHNRNERENCIKWGSNVGTRLPWPIPSEFRGSGTSGCLACWTIYRPRGRRFKSLQQQNMFLGFCFTCALFTNAVRNYTVRPYTVGVKITR